MQKNDIILSICIPTYNRAEIVHQCVLECLKIPSDKIEVVVNDNCSTDNTEELLGEISDSRFHYYKNETNIGYSNFYVSMTKGKGKFSLLLSDEDRFREADWDKTVERLEKDENTGVFQCSYFDEQLKCLVKPTEQRLEKDCYETYCFVRCNFAFCGGLIIRRELLNRIDKKINKNSFLWSLYPHIIAPLYCVQLSGCDGIDTLSVQRSERNAKGFSDQKAWKGNTQGTEPYWSLESRIKQDKEWIDLFSRMDIDEKVKGQLIVKICLDGWEGVVLYRGYITDEEMTASPLFMKRADIVERDRALGVFAWIKIFFSYGGELNGYMRKKINKQYFSFRVFLIYYLKVIVRFMRLLKGFSVKSVSKK